MVQEELEMQNKEVKNYGWRVTFAGMGINLALGVLYAWSVISEGVPDAWGWTETDKSLPYAIACLVFAAIMVPAGRMQDKIGPRLVATIGGILVGVGIVMASFFQAPIGYMIGFGVLTGAGIGFGYASATPPAVRWFSAAKTGMIAGLVVSGFGLAPVYAAPFTSLLLERFGLQRTMLIWGVIFLVVVVSLAQLLKFPPKDYEPPEDESTSGAKGSAPVTEDFLPTVMLRTPQFYMIWFMYACGAGAGLMIIAKLAAIAQVQAGMRLGFVLVAVLAVGNGAGRIIAGMLSDKIGRQKTLLLCFGLQAVLILLLSRATEGNLLANVFLLSVLSALIGANYGANLSLFPAITKDYFGSINFGANYGLVFTAWGFGGFMLATAAGKLYDIFGNFTYSYYSATGLLILAALMTLLLSHPKPLKKQDAEA